MNPRSLAKTLPGERITRRAVLKGYQRKMNFTYEGYAYLNIVPNPDASVSGVLIELTLEELALFSSREEGYVATAVGKYIDGALGDVVAFIAPDIECSFKVPRSYLNTCTAGMTVSDRETWLKETVMGEIEEDAEAPLYIFASQE